MDSSDFIALIPIYLASIVLGYGMGLRHAAKANDQPPDTLLHATEVIDHLKDRYAELAQRSNEEMTNLRKDIVAQKKLIDQHNWQPMESAPTDGTIVNVMGRYKDAMSSLAILQSLAAICIPLAVIASAWAGYGLAHLFLLFKSWGASPMSPDSRRITLCFAASILGAIVFSFFFGIV